MDDPNSLQARADALMDRVNARYNQQHLREREQQQQSKEPVQVVGWQGREMVVQGYGPQPVAGKRSLTTGAIGIGDVPAQHGDLLYDTPRVRQKQTSSTASTTTVKAGYIYSKTVSGSTALACPAPPPDGGGNPTTEPQTLPPTLSKPYCFVPKGQSRFVFIDVTGRTITQVGTGFSSRDGSEPYAINTVRTLPDQTFGSYLLTSGQCITYVEVPINDTDGVTSCGSLITRVGTRTDVYLDGNFLITRAYTFDRHQPSCTTVSGDTTYSDYTEALTCVVKVRPINGGIYPPGGSPTPENPANPATPDPAHSYEFWYNGGKATAPIKLKTLAGNQPLEATPYLIHHTASKSVAVLKYGNAANDNGNGDDLCKLSLLEITGTTDLNVTETIYSWSQVAELQTKLQALKNPFYAIVGSKSKVENINLGSLITNNKLDAKYRCFTHRNLSNLKTSLYLIDFAADGDTNLDTLTGEDFYTQSVITGALLTGTSLTAIARYFELKTNPSFAGGTPDCAANQAFRLLERPAKKVKKVKIPAINSTDASIKVLTFNASVV